MVLITLAGIIGIGYQSAEQKSEPIYRSKIDRIMYDTHNQSPKYVITLPDRNKKSKKPEEVVSVGEEAFQAETTAKPQKEEDPHSLEAVIARTPYLASLGSAGGQIRQRFDRRKRKSETSENRRQKKALGSLRQQSFGYAPF